MVRTLVKIPILILAIAVLTLAVSAQDNWVGEYFFDEDGGETSGGSKIYIAHTLTVFEEDGGLKARIYSQGFQTSFDLYADAKIEDGKLALYFREYGPDQMFKDLEFGDLLLTLETKEGILLTSWAGFKPTIVNLRANDDVRFKKTTGDPASAVDNWVGLEYPDKLSIGVPADFVYDGRKAGSLQNRVYSASDGLDILIKQYGNGGWKNNKKRMEEHVERAESVRILDPYFIHVEVTKTVGDKFAKTITIASPDLLLIISIQGNIIDVGKLNRFIDRLSVNGRGVTGQEILWHPKTKFVAGDLKTSALIDEALNRKPRGIQRNVNYKILGRNARIEHDTNYSRRPIVVDMQFPKNPAGIKIMMLVETRGDGQIGDMIVYSGLPPKKLDSYVDAAAKIKFVPAVKDGVVVDSWTLVTVFIRTIEY